MENFKNKKEELVWERTNFPTVGDLIEYLKRFPEDSLIYSVEANTGTYQHIPNLEQVFVSVKNEMENLRKFYTNWYRNTDGAKEKIENELKSIFKYINDKDGLCVVA